MQHKMSVLNLSWRQPKDADESRKAAKGAAGKGAKQQQHTGNAPAGTPRDSKQRNKRKPATAAMLAHSSADYSIVGRRAQVSLQHPTYLPVMPQLRHHRARGAPTLRVFSAKCG